MKIGLGRAFSILVIALTVAIVPGVAAAEGTIAPVTLEDLNGKKVKVDFSSAKITLVNFWAVWCMPCRDEIPEIARLKSEYGDKGLQVFGIAMESGEPAEVKDFLERNKGFGVNYPMLMGTDEVADSFGGVMAVPTTYLLDAKGKVLKTYVGSTRDFHAKVSAEIDSTLKAPGNTQTKPAP
ncbi:MAG: TlpA disulfide reductase family protein [Candidatus Polarisedimenticolia bacterium]